MSDRTVNWVRWFIYSAALVLILTAAAKFYSATGSARILTATDQVLHLTYRRVMLLAGSLEIAIGAYLIVGRNSTAKIWLVLWLSGNFLFYRCVTDFLGVKVCPCLGTIQSMLPFAKANVDFLLALVLFYLLFGSVGCIVYQYRSFECFQSVDVAPDG
jgi:hypothetical protein